MCVCVCVCKTDSLCCTPELIQHCKLTIVQKNFFKKEINTQKIITKPLMFGNKKHTSK